MKSSAELIVALDVDSYLKARHYVDSLYPKVKFFKVGLQLFTCCGDEVIAYLKKKGAKVFLDLKLHDIPNTVANAAKEVVRKKVDMFTVHSQGGLEMMQAAKQAAEQAAHKLGIKVPKIIAVTVLTSQANKGNIMPRVLKLAKLAKTAGLDGVVCSVKEAKALRVALGRGFIIVTPGIRLPSNKKQDQKRTATPREAVKSGSNFLVVGRPVLEAKDPAAVVEEMLRN